MQTTHEKYSSRHQAEARMYTMADGLATELARIESRMPAEAAARTWGRLGKDFKELGQLSRAADCFRKSLYHQPSHADFRWHLSSLLIRLNRWDELSTVLAGAPPQTQGRGLERDFELHRARLALRRGELECAKTAVRRLCVEDANLPVKVRAARLHLRGEIDSQLGLESSAFYHWTRANQLHAQHEDVRRMAPKARAMASRVRAAGSQCDQLATATWVRDQDDSSHPQPMFLVGFPRSGTTLLRRFIGTHATVVDLEEGDLLWPMDKHISQSNRAAALNQLSGAERDEMRAAYWKNASAKGVELQPSQRFLDKQPHLISSLDLVARLFPNARVVVALRHPGDVLLSNFGQIFRLNPATWHALDWSTLVQLYADVMTAYLKFRAQLPLQLIEIRYENLVADTRGELTSLFRELELPWDSRILRQHELRHNDVVTTPSYHQVARPVYMTSIGRWRRAQEIWPAHLSVLQPVAKRLGYTF